MSQSVPSANLDEATIEAFDLAQRRTISLMRRVVAELRTGQSPEEIIQIARNSAESFGFNNWFREPTVQLDAPKSAFRSGKSTALQHGMMVEINLSPSNDTAFGNLGHALVFGSDEEPEMLVQARELCRAACGFSNRFKCTGEVFVFAQAWAVNRSKSLGRARSVGHRCFPRSGRSNLHWPKMARAAIYLRRNQIGWFNYRRMDGIYAIQPRLISTDMGLSFQEMIFVEEHGQRILGRDHFDEIGTL